MIRLRSIPRKSVAKTIAVLAGLVTAGCTVLLVGEHIVKMRRVTPDKARIETLLEAAKQDPERLTILREEQDRQRDISLAREARQEIEAYVLIVAAIIFITATKWAMRLGGKRIPDRATVTGKGAATPGDNPGSGNGPAIAPPAAAPSHTNAFEFDPLVVDEMIERIGTGPDAAIPILHAVQDRYRFLPDAALQRVCERTRITPAQIVGVSSFYTQFRRTPVGEHLIKVCHGTACHVAGAGIITDEIRRSLGIAPGQDTDARRLFTIEEVACLGCCTLAPVVQIDETTYGHLAPNMVAEMLHDCLSAGKSATNGKHRGVTAAIDASDVPKPEIRVGLGSCCVAGGSGGVYEALHETVAEMGIDATIKRVGCVGMCHQTPLVETVLPDGSSSLFAGVSADDVRAIVRRQFRPKGLLRRIKGTAASVLESFATEAKRKPTTYRSIEVRDPPVAAFLGRQKHIATQHCGEIDPTDLDEYFRLGGFKAYRQCVKELTPDDVIHRINESGLRGRGGAGFPSGAKWKKVREARGEPKYVICNGDEGDPGAFMDRMLMESFPYRIIEGLAIAAYAVGTQKGYFYVRAEYPLAVKRLREALELCTKRGLLGNDIFGAGIKVELDIMEGAGAFVCGEETALIASIEGQRGMPRLRPPFPAEGGLWDKPTLVNNVETLATVPWIIREGVDAFRALGTDTSKGTKVFSLAGKVERGGLIEVPMGVTIREIVMDIGGGMKNGRTFKAVQIGGPSGGCIPAELADTPVDYEALVGAGAIMGSGGLVVMDERDCMVDIARYFLSFTQNQSCGKCTYCRIGTRRMLDILEALCAGRGRRDDLVTLERLAHDVNAGSLCGLGKTAPNPILTTLRYFRDEYEAHLEGRCPAGKCQELITYRVKDGCIGCTLCSQNCPVDAIPFTPYERHVVDADKCTRCDICRTSCPEEAIEVV